MPSLFLHPGDAPWRPPDLCAFAARLRTLGLLGPERSSDSAHEYYAGEAFLKLVMFLGCSPQVQLDSRDGSQGQAMVSVRLIAFGDPVLLVTNPFPAVRCRACRAAAVLPAAMKSGAAYRCQACGKETPLSRLDWRQGAGYGQFFLELSGIYPHEAVPADKLLGELQAISCCKWAYFYASQPSCRTL